MIETESIIRDVVSSDFRAAAIFQKYGLDFCCGGGKSIAEACGAKGIESTDLMRELERLDASPAAGVPRFNEWDLELLIDYILVNHHRYIRENAPVILAHVTKVASVHGERHPEVIRIAKSFESVLGELMQHMMKEEQILFPYVKQMVEARNEGRALPRLPFGTIGNPIRMMEMEHESAGNELAEIRSLSSDYTPPEDACMTYRVAYQELHAFEQDLHQHVHLENNILFPKAIDLEKELKGAVMQSAPSFFEHSVN